MPSLIVQLDEAAEGTGIRFTKIATGERTDAPAAAPATPPAATPPTRRHRGPGDAPRRPAASRLRARPAAAAESANNAAATSSQRNAAAEQSGVSPTDAQTSTSSGQRTARRRRRGRARRPAPRHELASAGLETVPLELEFTGDFFNLADFFHDVKRFVRVANTQRGRQRPPDHDRRRQVRERPGALPEDQGRAHGHRLPVAEGGGRDRRRDARRARPAPRRASDAGGRAEPTPRPRPRPRPQPRLHRGPSDEALPHSISGTTCARSASGPWRWSSLLGLVAVPVLLAKPAEDPAPPPAVAVPARRPVRGRGSRRARPRQARRRPTARLRLDARRVRPRRPVPAAQEGDHEEGRRRARPATAPTSRRGSAARAGSGGDGARAAAARAAAASHPGGGETGGDPGGGDGTTTTTTVYKYVVDVTFSANGRTRRIKGLEKLDMLPSQASPLLIFMGVTAEGRRRGLPGRLDARGRRRGPLQAERLRLRVRLHRRRLGARVHRRGRRHLHRCGSTRSARSRSRRRPRRRQPARAPGARAHGRRRPARRFVPRCSPTSWSWPMTARRLKQRHRQPIGRGMRRILTTYLTLVAAALLMLPPAAAAPRRSAKASAPTITRVTADAPPRRRPAHDPRPELQGQADARTP